MQKKNILIFLTVLFLHTVNAQHNSLTDGKLYNGIRLKDLAGKCEDYTVIKESVPLLSSTSVLIDKTIYTAYIIQDSVKNIGFSRSSDGGKTWESASFGESLNAEDPTSVSLFDISGRNRKRSSSREMILFTGGKPLKSSIATPGTEFPELAPVNFFGSYRITSLLKSNNGKLFAVFHDDGRFIHSNENNNIRRSVIYTISSDDGGKTWTLPEVAVRHNQYGLYDAVIFENSNKKERELIMIASERVSGTAYISFNKENGGNWSYPVALPDFIQGDRFSVTMINKTLYIAYRDLCRYFRDGTINPFFGDLVMWTGDLKELVKGRKNGLKVRIADNYPQDSAPDFTDLRVFDCGYPTIIPVSKNRLSISAYGRWDSQEPPYVKSFIINTELLK